MPEVNGGLVGRVMNYTFFITPEGKSRRTKYTYTGVITEAITHTERKKGKEVKVMTAVCTWTEAGDGKEAGDSSVVILLADKYGQCDKQDGWFVHDHDGEIAELYAKVCSVQASMQQHILREFTCMDPKSEYGVCS